VIDTIPFLPNVNEPPPSRPLQSPILLFWSSPLIPAKAHHRFIEGRIRPSPPPTRIVPSLPLENPLSSFPIDWPFWLLSSFSVRKAVLHADTNKDGPHRLVGFSWALFYFRRAPCCPYRNLTGSWEIDPTLSREICRNPPLRVVLLTFFPCQQCPLFFPFLDYLDMSS